MGSMKEESIPATVQHPELTDGDIALIIHDAVMATRGTSWHEFARLVLHFDRDREALARLCDKYAHRITKVAKEAELREKVDAARYYKGVE